ncbi:MAG: RHS repeat-associated core domain-containing protein [Terracidiphilus sp.]
MTTAAICATRAVSWSPSFYRGEQFDSDLGLYYLRARYYNPATGRFLSRDPEDGFIDEPASLHKYLYAGGDPVNAKDPTGRNEEEDADIEEEVVVKEGPTILEYVKDVVTAYCVLATTLSVRAFLHSDEHPRPVPILNPFGIGVCLARTAGSAFGKY